MLQSRVQVPVSAPTIRMNMHDPSEYKSRLTADLLWYAIDLDGTLAEDIWPEDGIGHPIPEAVKYCNQVISDGGKIAIWTARPWVDYEAIERWLNDHGIPWHKIVCGKLLAKVYVDDKAIKPSWVK